VFAKSLLVTAAAFVLLALGAWWLIDRWAGDWAGSGVLASVGAAAAAILGGWLLFRAVAVAVVGLFADEVVEVVEARHYPQALATARPVPFVRAARQGLRSAARAVAVNLLLLPPYLVLLATGVGAPMLFLAANGWLLGQDLGEMAAARHGPPAATRGWRRANRGSLFALGLVGTAALVVPGLNLLASVLGAAMATHLFHRSRT